MENSKKYEIERKYLFKNLPESLGNYRYIEIEQGYISTVPVVRIRKKISHPGMAETDTAVKESYVLTIKSSGMLTRQEYEMSISVDEYENLKKKVDGNVISKTRYLIPVKALAGMYSSFDSNITPQDIESLILELDIFHDDFSGLVMGEVEFPDEKTADSFESAGIFSSDLVKEVTFDKRFHNSTMSAMSQDEITQFINSLS
jgi:CYTH domain-containing protein